MLSSTVSGGGITKVGNGTLTLSGTNTYDGTTTVQAGTLLLKSNAQVPVLTNAGGADVQGGKLVLDYAGATSPAASVRSILASGYSSNFATGRIRSTTLATGRTLGYGDNGSAVTIRLTLAGDTDLDGGVSINDFNLLAGNFGRTLGTPSDGPNSLALAL